MLSKWPQTLLDAHFRSLKCRAKELESLRWGVLSYQEWMMMKYWKLFSIFGFCLLQRKSGHKLTESIIAATLEGSILSQNWQPNLIDFFRKTIINCLSNGPPIRTPFAEVTNTAVRSESDAKGWSSGSESRLLLAFSRFARLGIEEWQQTVKCRCSQTEF